MRKINKRNIKAAYSRWLYFTKAWTSDQKIVVIESDDWGSIRTSHKKAYQTLLNFGYQMSKSPYTLDALESNSDMHALYDVLTSVKDNRGNAACVTANMIMANPDFEAIEQNKFSEYVYETVDKTLNNYKEHNQVRSLWKEGMNSNIFFPQLHAREHLRYWDWMKDLQAGKNEAIKTFKLKMCGVPKAVSKTGTSYFHPPYVDDKILREEGIDLNRLITEGAELFSSEFGFESKTTIAPNCGWTNSTEQVWRNNGIEYIQGGFLQEHHMKSTIKFIPHYLGESSKTEEVLYLVRNCSFEPSRSEDINYWRSTYQQIENAFKRNTPALVSTHRVNFIGYIDEKNRTHGLLQLKNLLSEIVKNHPDVRFMNSFQLAELISNNKKIS